MMSTETVTLTVLRALLSLSRQKGPATLAGLVARVASERGEASDAAAVAAVERALGSLARQQLVSRTGELVRLSFAGLAVAAAVTADARARRAAAKKRRPSVRIVRDRRATASAPHARIIPLVAGAARVRRHRAA